MVSFGRISLEMRGQIQLWGRRMLGLWLDVGRGGRNSRLRLGMLGRSLYTEGKRGTPGLGLQGRRFELLLMWW